MSGYTIHDVPTIEVDSEAKSILEGSDITQESLELYHFLQGLI